MQLLSNRHDCMPTIEQYKQRDNLYVLAYETNGALRVLKLSEKTIDNYTLCGFNPILKYFATVGLTKYDSDVMMKFVDSIRGTIGRSSAQNIRKSAAWLSEYYYNRCLTWSVLPNYGTRQLPAEYEENLGSFLVNARRLGLLAESSQITVRQQCKRFLFALEDEGIGSISRWTPRSVNDAIVKITCAYSGGISAIVFSVRSLLLHLYKQQVTIQDFSTSIPRMVAPRRIVQEGFTNEEASLLFDAARLNLVSPKRDLAIMLLAAVTGIRAVDIAALKRDNIDWRANEIRIVQHKTGNQLSLPLTIAVGNAIADYLLNERPACEAPNIFICLRRPYRPMDSRAVVNMVHRYLLKTSIAKGSKASHLGIHSFRRAFGRRLLSANAALPLISEMLGHADVDSSKTYLAIHESELKRCAITMASITAGGAR